MISRTDVELDVFELEFLGHHNDVQSAQRLACSKKLAPTDDAAPGTLALDSLSPTADGSMVYTQPPAQSTVTLALLERAGQLFKDGARAITALRPSRANAFWRSSAM